MLSDILLTHAKKYPLLQPSDIVKLCYQSEFGVAHFVKKDCLADIEKEYASAVKDGAEDKFTDIGNGYVRVSLKALKKEDLPRLAEAFEKTSLLRSGSVGSFAALLDESLQIVNENEGSFSFSAHDYASFLREYERLSFPPIRHSETYRSAYRPSYRVIKSDYVNLLTDNGV